MLGERLKEIIEFARTESPYRSANKGWVTDDVYLQWGADKDNSSSNFDQLVKISFYWQPIIQIASLLLVIIFMASIFAFTPRAFSHGKFSSISNVFELIPKSVPVEEKVDSALSSESILKDESANIDKDISEVKTIPTNPNPLDGSKSIRKTVTATDLFQPKH